MGLFNNLMPGAKQRRAEKLANTVRDLIVGQQTATLVYTSDSGLYSAGAAPGSTVFAITSTPVPPSADTDRVGVAVSNSNAGRANNGRRVEFHESPEASDGALMAAAVSVAVANAGADDSNSISESRSGEDKKRSKKDRLRRHKQEPRHKHHTHRHKHDKRRSAQREKALKRLQQPDTLSTVLDMLRLMPNPFKTQSLMQQMFQHDWRSMSMPDLLATQRRKAIIDSPAGSCPNGNNSNNDEDDDLPPESIEAQTYWWGYEIYIPPRTLQKLEDEGDVATGVLYFLGALSKTVPLIYPFVNMIATYVAMQFTIIKAADRGNGIILVATW